MAREQYLAELAHSATEQAEQRGVLIGRVQLAERLLKQGPTPQETLHDMTHAHLRELADRLEAQLVGRS